MRKRLSIILVLSSSVVGLLWFWMTKPPRTAVEPDRDRIEQRTTVAGPAAISKSAQTPRPMSDRDPQKIFEAVESSNVPIKFWGKVVDQDAQPLKEVRIEYDYTIEHGNMLGIAWGDQERRTGDAVTDGNGLFSIQGLNGHHLGIRSLKKRGYQFRSKEALIFDFYGSNPLGKFVPNQQRPVHFTMVHKDATEPLVHSEGSLRVDGVGGSGRWDLWSGESDPEGELVVTLKPALPDPPVARARWSVELQIIGGGLITASWDEDVRQAPESGYFLNVAYPEMEQKQGVPYRSFYLRTVDGKHGRIQVQLYTDDEGPSVRCYIICDMNPRPGSRNLEPTEEE